MKKCNICKEIKDENIDFYKDRSRKDWLCFICKKCTHYKNKVYIHWREWRKYILENECYLCWNTKNLCLDHDHVTKLKRWTLCSWCNTALGRLWDSITALERVVSYLKWIKN